MTKGYQQPETHRQNEGNNDQGLSTTRHTDKMRVIMTKNYQQPDTQTK